MHLMCLYYLDFFKICNTWFFTPVLGYLLYSADKVTQTYTSEEHVKLRIPEYLTAFNPELFLQKSSITDI